MPFHNQLGSFLTHKMTVQHRLQASRYISACTQIILLIDFKGGAAYNATSQRFTSDDSVTPLEQFAALDELLRHYQGMLCSVCQIFRANFGVLKAPMI